MTTPATPEQDRKTIGDENNDAIFREAGRSLINLNKTFEVLRYPLDVADPKHPHSILFFINVRKNDASGAEKAQLKGKDAAFDNSKSNRTTTEGSPVAIKTAAFLGGVGLGVAVTNAVVDPGVFRTLSKVAGAGAGAFVGLAGAAIVDPGNKTQVLLKSVIALHMSGPPQTDYKASWADTDLGLASILGGESGGITSLRDFMQKSQGFVTAATLKGAESIKSNILGDFGGTAQSTSAITPNPFKAQLFKNMGFRQFGFDYVFLPKSFDEYNEITKIIQLFKQYMHPTLGKGKFILNYPAEFTIAYYHRGIRNKELFRISNCALTDLKIKYGGDDFTTFAGTDGNPTEISMHIAFTEMETLTQERILDGY